MLVAIIIIAIVLVSLIAVLILRKVGMFEFVFGNSITRKVEKRRRMIGEIEVLKKQQKVKCEEILKTFAQDKADLAAKTDAEINSLQAQILSLKEHKKTQTALLDEREKVVIDETINKFDQMIVNKQNQVKRLNRYIDAEQKNIEDVINPDTPNAPAVQESRIMGFRDSEPTEVKTSTKTTKTTKIPTTKKASKKA